jgi:hypothetical protein
MCIFTDFYIRIDSGAEVYNGVKYTMRSDVMFEFEEGEDDGGVVFG